MNKRFLFVFLIILMLFSVSVYGFSVKEYLENFQETGLYAFMTGKTITGSPSGTSSSGVGSTSPTSSAPTSSGGAYSQGGTVARYPGGTTPASAPTFTPVTMPDVPATSPDVSPEDEALLAAVAQISECLPGSKPCPPGFTCQLVNLGTNQVPSYKCLSSSGSSADQQKKGMGDVPPGSGVGDTAGTGLKKSICGYSSKTRIANINPGTLCPSGFSLVGKGHCESTYKRCDAGSTCNFNCGYGSQMYYLQCETACGNTVENCPVNTGWSYWAKSWPDQVACTSSQPSISITVQKPTDISSQPTIQRPTIISRRPATAVQGVQRLQAIRTTTTQPTILQRLRSTLSPKRLTATPIVRDVREDVGDKQLGAVKKCQPDYFDLSEQQVCDQNCKKKIKTDADWDDFYPLYQPRSAFDLKCVPKQVVGDRTCLVCKPVKKEDKEIEPLGKDVIDRRGGLDVAEKPKSKCAYPYFEKTELSLCQKACEARAEGRNEVSKDVKYDGRCVPVGECLGCKYVEYNPSLTERKEGTKDVGETAGGAGAAGASGLITPPDITSGAKAKEIPDVNIKTDCAKEGMDDISACLNECEGKPNSECKQVIGTTNCYECVCKEPLVDVFGCESCKSRGDRCLRAVKSFTERNECYYCLPPCLELGASRDIDCSYRCKEEETCEYFSEIECYKCVKKATSKEIEPISEEGFVEGIANDILDLFGVPGGSRDTGIREAKISEDMETLTDESREPEQYRGMETTTPGDIKTGEAVPSADIGTKAPQDYLEEKCEIGEIIGNKYCSLDGVLKDRKETGEYCGFNAECKTGRCVNNVCEETTIRKQMSSFIAGRAERMSNLITNLRKRLF